MTVALAAGSTTGVTNTRILTADDSYTEDYAFPEVNPGQKPIGNRIIVQLARPRTKIGNIFATSMSQAIERDNQMTAKVVAIGPLCFHDRTTFTEWPEGPWFAVGDYIRVPKYGGDRIRRPAPTHDLDDGAPAAVEFVTFEETQALSVVTCNPLELLTFNG